MTHPTAIYLLLCSVLIAPWARAEEAANPSALPFVAAGAIRMKLNKGEMEVVGADTDRITVSWTPADAKAGVVKVKLERLGDNEATVLVDGPGDRVKYRIEVPRRSDVAIHMRAGQLDVHGIAGSMDVDLMAGQMTLRLVDPLRYRSVEASVTAGELDAEPWRVEKSGLWRSIKGIGEGDYDLRARLLAGQLTIRAD
jgi:hypothetical protein